jgi:glycosyltransferase involved in cell wall biosynthesis
MRIAIDYTPAVWQGAGIGRYTRELIHAVVAQGAAHEFCLFYAALGARNSQPSNLRDMRGLLERHAHVRSVGIPLPPRRLAQLWHRARAPLPIELVTGPVDLIHAPDFVPPPSFAPAIVTVHDLSYMVHPECALPSVARYLSAAVPRGLRRAAAIMADSAATKRDLERLLAIDPGRISVVYPGVGAQFRPLPAAELAPVRVRLGLPERFLLFVSTIEPRKNLPRLLEAYAQLDQAIAPPLVIGGRRGWMYEAVFAAIERLGLRDRVYMLDFVADNDLPALYNLAWAFVYPSIYEGFGIPPLEALACGTPVLTADNSSLPEVVGDAAVVVAADDTHAIAAGLQRIIQDDTLRARLRAAGPARAQRFRWERAAQQVLGLYDQHGRSRNRMVG